MRRAFIFVLTTRLVLQPSWIPLIKNQDPHTYQPSCKTSSILSMISKPSRSSNKDLYSMQIKNGCEHNMQLKQNSIFNQQSRKNQLVVSYMRMIMQINERSEDLHTNKQNFSSPCLLMFKLNYNLIHLTVRIAEKSLKQQSPRGKLISPRV